MCFSTEVHSIFRVAAGFGWKYDTDLVNWLIDSRCTENNHWEALLFYVMSGLEHDLMNVI